MDHTRARADPERRPSLVRHGDFRRLWIGDTASQLGQSIGIIALPYLAVTVLAASEFQMGLLGTLTSLGFLIIGLPAGAIVDRYPKRSVMILADVGRAALLATIPIAWWLGVLTLAQLMVVATAGGMLTVFFDVSYQSYLPVLVDRRDVVQGNAKLQASQSVSQAAGPALGGFLIRALGPALVVAVTAAGYLASALALGRIRHRESPAPASGRESILSEIGEGLRFVVKHPLLARLIGCTGIANLAGSMANSLMVLYMVRELHFSAVTIGVVESVAAIGGLAGALLATPVTRLLGEGPMIIASATAMLAAAFYLPLSALGRPLPVMVIGSAVATAMIVVYNIATVSFRQRLCPPKLLGRMNASARFLVWGTIPIGSFLGGVLATRVGLVPTLWISATASCLALLPLLFSPLWRMRTLPSHDEHDDDPADDQADGEADDQNNGVGGSPGDGEDISLGSIPGGGRAGPGSQTGNRTAGAPAGDAAPAVR